MISLQMGIVFEPHVTGLSVESWVQATGWSYSSWQK